MVLNILKCYKCVCVCVCVHATHAPGVWLAGTHESPVCAGMRPLLTGSSTHAHTAVHTNPRDRTCLCAPLFVHVCVPLSTGMSLPYAWKWTLVCPHALVHWSHE